MNQIPSPSGEPQTHSPLREIQAQIHSLLDLTQVGYFEHLQNIFSDLQNLILESQSQSKISKKEFHGLNSSYDLLRDQSLASLRQTDARYAKVLDDIDRLGLPDHLTARYLDTLEEVLMQQMHPLTGIYLSIRTTKDLKKIINKTVLSGVLGKKNLFEVESVELYDICFRELSKKQIKTFFQLLAPVRELYFFQSTILEFDDEELRLFAGLKNLRYMYFQDGILTHLWRAGKFELLTPLLKRQRGASLSESLALIRSEDDVDTFFGALSNLRSLEFRPLDTWKIPIDLLYRGFVQMPHLISVSFEDSGIEHLSEEYLMLFNVLFKQLKFIDLSKNRLERLSMSQLELLFQDLPKLQELELSDCGLGEDTIKQIHDFTRSKINPESGQ